MARATGSMTHRQPVRSISDKVLIPARKRER